jgi:outer membrane beta-barrel protein
MRLPRILAGLTAAVAALTAAPAFAQETVDIGTIQEEDIVVVQRLLYPKDGRTELGVHLGVMPFDAFLFTPNLQLTFDRHFNEKVSLSVALGGGYGLKNGTLRELESPEFGKTPDAYRYLGSLLVGAAWAPIYAKVNLDGARVLHHDLYGVVRAGITLEQSIIEGFSPSPTLSLGVGARVWTSERFALRFEVRDDMLIQRRSLTESTHFKQNVNLTIGFVRFSPPQRRSR